MNTIKNLIAILFSCLVLIACSSNSSKPPYLGVFLKDGNIFSPLDNFTGPPEESISINIENTNPTFTVWLENFNSQNFLLVSYENSDRIKNQVSFNLRPIQDNIYDVLISELPEPDIYCFVQVDPLSVVYRMPHWCFEFGNDEHLSEILQKTNSPTNVNSTTQSSTELKNQELTNSATPTFTNDPNSTSQVQSDDLIIEYSEKWTIELGEIRSFGIAKDGYLYGITSIGSKFNPTSHVVINPDGEVEKITKIPELEICEVVRVGDRNSFGPSFSSKWPFLVTDDGTLICGSYSGKTMLLISSNGELKTISSENRIYITTYENLMTIVGSNVVFLDEYGEKIIEVPFSGIEIPNDTSLRSFGRKNPYTVIPINYFYEGFLFYSESELTFINSYYDKVVFPTPDDLIVDDSNPIIEYFVGYDGSLLYSYNRYDQLGNLLNLETKFMDRHGNSGEVENVYPMELFLKAHDQPKFFNPYFAFVHDFDDPYSLKKIILNENRFPQSTPNILRIPFDATKNNFFVGGDGNIYTFTTVYFTTPDTLTKYSSISEQPNLPEDTLDFLVRQWEISPIQKILLVRDEYSAKTKENQNDQVYLFNYDYYSENFSKIQFMENDEEFWSNGKIISIEGVNKYPVFSPDGTKVAYVNFNLNSLEENSSRLVVADLKTNENLIISQDIAPEFPCWSPDGNQIAFKDLKSKSISIFDLNTNLINIIYSHAEDAYGLIWSPDGNFIAFDYFQNQI